MERDPARAAAHVAVDIVVQLLIARIGVDRRHIAAFDAEGFVQDRSNGCQAVRGARRDSR